MADPWADFRAKPTAPVADEWADFRAPKAERGVIDKLTGRDGGERYQTFPEKIVRGVLGAAKSGATLPGDVMAGKASPDDTGRVLDLATMAMPVSPASRAMTATPEVTAIIGHKTPAVPTTRELATAGAADINAAKASDLRIAPEALSDFSRILQQKIGVHPVDAQNTFAKLKDLEKPPAGSFVTPADLQALRGSLQDTAQNFNPNFAKDQLAASRAIAELDGFLRNLGAKDTVVGPTTGEPATRAQLVARALEGKREADRVAGLFETGRGNYSAAMRSNDLTGELDKARTGLLERAEGRAHAANSGWNIDNTIRSKAESILEKPKEISGLSSAELAAVERIHQGGKGRNLAREIGNRLAGGGGVGSTLLTGATGAAGMAVGGWPGAVVGAAIPTGAGVGAKAIANALAKKDIGSAAELMRKRSPLYEHRVANPEAHTVSPVMQAEIARLLMMQAMGQPQ